MGTQKLVHLNCCLSRETSFKDLIQVRNMHQFWCFVVILIIGSDMGKDPLEPQKTKLTT